MNQIDRFWINSYFGCSKDDYYSDKNVVCPLLLFKGYNGFFVLRINNKFVISAPESYEEPVRNAAKENLDFYNADVWKDLLGSHYNSIIGPAWIGYYNKTKPIQMDPSCRILNLNDENDRNKLLELQNCCDTMEWRNSSIDLNSIAVAAKLLEDQIVSAASYHLWGETVAQVGIITHPSYRKKGFAKDVLLTLTAHGNEKKMIMQYRTLCSNTAAVRAALVCGYEFYATHISVRLN